MPVKAVDGAPGNLPVVTRESASLTPEIVEDLKARLIQYGLPPVLYKVSLNDLTVVFRPLYWRDQRELDAFERMNTGQITISDMQEKICERAVLWPEDMTEPVRWQTQLAGLQELLTNQVRARSGYLTRDTDQSAYLTIEPLTTVDPGRKPTDVEVAELKSRYNWALKLVGLEGEWYVVRPISRAEMKILDPNTDPDVNLHCCERAVVWSKSYPEKVDFGESMLAGVPDSLSDVIMQISAFGSRPTVEAL
jgi:hypothetical protein